MERVVLIAVVLTACGLKTTRTPKNKGVLRPVEVGTFKGYTIAPCDSGGHVVKREHEPDERGEANNPSMVVKYRDQFLIPKVDFLDLGGWTYDSPCAKSGMTLRVPEGQVGEALHRIGEVLKAQPTDIEVVVIPSKP
jgi:hypothetical protein